MPKLLADFLQEQQEPFALEAYLLERGYSKRLDARCTMHNSSKHAPPNCSHFLRGVFSQFLVVANADKRVEGDIINGGREKANAARDGVSPASSSTTLFNSCLESDGGGSHCSEAATRRFVKCGNCFLEGEVDADANFKLRAEEDNKQLSPVSVLDEDSPLHYKHYNLKTRETESSNSRSHCKSQQPRRVGFQEWRELNQYDQYMINKTALQQRKQLLIDCRREVIEKYREKEKHRELEMKKMLGGEDVWKPVCKTVWIWSQDSSNESNIVHLLHSDFMASIDEWDADFEQQKFEISMEIENDILENVVNEIIRWW